MYVSSIFCSQVSGDSFQSQDSTAMNSTQDLIPCGWVPAFTWVQGLSGYVPKTQINWVINIDAPIGRIFFSLKNNTLHRLAKEVLAKYLPWAVSKIQDKPKSDFLKHFKIDFNNI